MSNPAVSEVYKATVGNSNDQLRACALEFAIDALADAGFTYEDTDASDNIELLDAMALLEAAYVKMSAYRATREAR